MISPITYFPNPTKRRSSKILYILGLLGVLGISPIGLNSLAELRASGASTHFNSLEEAVETANRDAARLGIVGEIKISRIRNNRDGKRPRVSCSINNEGYAIAIDERYLNRHSVGQGIYRLYANGCSSMPSDISKNHAQEYQNDESNKLSYVLHIVKKSLNEYYNHLRNFRANWYVIKIGLIEN